MTVYILDSLSMMGQRLPEIVCVPHLLAILLQNCNLHSVTRYVAEDRPFSLAFVPNRRLISLIRGNPLLVLPTVQFAASLAFANPQT